MGVIVKLYKDYEFGWYGHHGSYGGMMFNSQACHSWFRTTEFNRKSRNIYNEFRNNTLKQIPKLSTVRFIHGEYYEVI